MTRKIPSILLTLAVTISGCRGQNYDPIPGDSCKLAKYSDNLETMSALEEALTDCARYEAVKEIAIACSHLDYIDAPRAYSVNLIKKCGSSADIDRVYEHGFTEIYDEIFDRSESTPETDSSH